jgi:SMC interacting uncharacterized protein involved in chromosome segregation
MDENIERLEENIERLEKELAEAKNELAKAKADRKKHNNIKYDREKYYDEEPSIKSISVEEYENYVFTLDVELDNGDNIIVHCGGNADNIYGFNPYGEWSAWKSAEIQGMRPYDEYNYFY